MAVDLIVRWNYSVLHVKNAIIYLAKFKINVFDMPKKKTIFFFGLIAYLVKYSSLSTDLEVVKDGEIVAVDRGEPATLRVEYISL